MQTLKVVRCEGLALRTESHCALLRNNIFIISNRLENLEVLRNIYHLYRTKTIYVHFSKYRPYDTTYRLYCTDQDHQHTDQTMPYNIQTIPYNTQSKPYIIQTASNHNSSTAGITAIGSKNTLPMFYSVNLKSTNQVTIQS